jgi:hypothetical protein
MVSSSKFPTLFARGPGDKIDRLPVVFSFSVLFPLVRGLVLVPSTRIGTSWPKSVFGSLALKTPSFFWLSTKLGPLVPRSCNHY